MENTIKKWKKIANGVFSAEIGDITKKEMTLTELSGVSPRFDALEKIKNAEFPFQNDIVSYQVASKLVLCIPLNENEILYGGGLKFKNSIINNDVLHLKANHYNGRDDGRTHAPIPFYISDKGYGFFINTSHYVDMHMGTANRKDSARGFRDKDRTTDTTWIAQPIGDYVEISINNAESAHVVLFSGENILEVVQRYNLYCGGGFIPPKWGLGIWKRVPLPANATEVIDNIKEFREKDFPLDVVGLEPGWHSNSYPCTYEWDSVRFKTPHLFVKDALDLDVKLNLWENGYVSPKSKIFDDLLPYSGSHTVWGGIVPDYTIEKAMKITQKQHKKDHIDIGISGYKLDECDGFDNWLWPDHAEFPSGNSAEQIRNTYGLLLQKMTNDIYRSVNKRTYGLTRATNAGANSFPYVLYNDCYSFDEFLTGLCNCGFIGTMWVPEVRDSKDSNEWLRRCQLVCFSPMAMINAWVSNIEPWSFADVSDHVKDVFLLRKRMLPYFYSAFSRYYYEGIPPFRSIAMEFNGKENSESNITYDTKNPYAISEKKSITNQFFFGDSILVAPLAPKQNQREVILPDGKWFDFYTGEFAGANEKIMTSKGQIEIPLYVKDGGIIPMTCANGDILEIRYYGKKDGVFMLYDDDGESFDYEKGMYTLTEISVTHENTKAILHEKILYNQYPLGKKQKLQLMLMTK